MKKYESPAMDLIGVEVNESIAYGANEEDYGNLKPIS